MMFIPGLKIYRRKNNPKPKSAQVAIELIAGVIVMFLLLYGMLRVFLYLNATLVKRQQAYEATRNEVSDPDYKQYYYRHHDYHVFPQEGDVYDEEE